MLDLMEPQNMNGNLSGGTTSLLRVARTQCRAAVAFVALTVEPDMFATATYPVLSDDDVISVSALDEVIHQVWGDPDFGPGSVLIRPVRATNRRLAGAKYVDVALARLDNGPDGQPRGILGVAASTAGQFGDEVNGLTQLASRMSSYLRARQEMRQWVARDFDDPKPAYGSELLIVDSAPSPSPSLSPPAPQPASAPAPVSEQEEELAIRTSADLQNAPVPELARVPEPEPEPELARVPEPEPEPELAPVTAPEPELARVPEPELASVAAPLPVSAPVPAAASPRVDPLQELLQEADPLTGLPPLSTLLGRTGRMLGAGYDTDGSLAVVVVEVSGELDSDEALRRIGQALRDRLRFDDPVARLGSGVFVAVVPLVPGITTGDVVERTLADAVEDAVTTAGAENEVRSVHIVVGLRERHDADVLLRAAVEKLRAG